MKLWAFCLLTTLALLYAGLTIGETVTYRRWEQAVNDQKDVQIKITYYQNLSKVLDSLMHRMAYDSLHDPALAQMLKDHKIKIIVIGGSPTASEAPNVPNGTAPAAPAPLPPDTSTPAPAAATQPHP